MPCFISPFDIIPYDILPYAAISLKIPRFKPPSYTPSVKPAEKEIQVTESKTFICLNYSNNKISLFISMIKVTFFSQFCFYLQSPFHTICPLPFSLFLYSRILDIYCFKFYFKIFYFQLQVERDLSQNILLAFIVSISISLKSFTWK